MQDTVPMHSTLCGITVLHEWWVETSVGREHYTISSDYENVYDARTDMLRMAADDRRCGIDSRYTLRRHYERPDFTTHDLVLSSRE